MKSNIMGAHPNYSGGRDGWWGSGGGEWIFEKRTKLGALEKRGRNRYETQRDFQPFCGGEKNTSKDLTSFSKAVHGWPLALSNPWGLLDGIGLNFPGIDFMIPR